MEREKLLLKLARRVKDLRHQRSISQEKLAELADLHPTFIGKIERAEINPSMVTIGKIAQAFNLPVSGLLTFPDDEKLYDKSAETLVGSLQKTIKDLMEIYRLAQGLKTSKKEK